MFFFFIWMSSLRNQRWANSVLTTEYEYEYYSVFRKWPNTNANNIRSSKSDRIRIRILFGLPKMIRIIFGPPKITEYEYEYYSVYQKWPITNLKGQKFILVAFVLFISTVCFQMRPQIVCLKRFKSVLVTFVWFFSTVGFKILTRRG